MSPRERRRGRTVFAMIGCLYAGIAIGWALHARLTPDVVPHDVPQERPLTMPTASQPRAEGAVATAGENLADPAAELRRRHLRVPIDGADIERMKGGFGERRDAGGRGHEAVDLLAPRHTPIHAVENGTIAKLFESKAGGTTIYQFDPTGRFSYYYAHLERYAEGLHEGQAIARGQVIGYVGTSGNAPPDTPHLHFAIFALTPERRWWEGTPLDPYEAFRNDESEAQPDR